MTESVTNALIPRRTFLLGLGGLALLPLTIQSVKAADFEPFSFAFVTDICLTNSHADSFQLFQESQLFLQDVIKQLNEKQLDFIVFGGDQVYGLGKNEENWNLFLDIAQVLNTPWSFVLGESDTMGDLLVDKIKQFGPDWKARGIETNKPYWSQTPLPGVHIIGLDTSLTNSTVGDVSPRQLDWLKQDLETHQGKFTIVFSHHPLLPPNPFDGGGLWSDYTVTQGAAIRELLGNYPDVHLAISGHVHVSKIQQERSIWYVSTPSLDTYPCAYRVFHVTQNSTIVETFPVSFPALIKKARGALAESNLAFNFNKARPEDFIAIAQGSREDQNAILSYQAGSNPKPYLTKKNHQSHTHSSKHVQPTRSNVKVDDNQKTDTNQAGTESSAK